MKAKLTLSIEESVIEYAKRYAKESGDSLSNIVENYMKLIARKNKNEHSSDQSLSPRIQRIKGIAKIDDDRDYKEILAEGRMKDYLRLK